MASPQKPAPKQSSRWGFLQQAVASVESRLDTILADEEDLPKKAVPAQAKENAPVRRASGDLSRSNSGTQANDRLQQRLARAMAKKNASTTGTPVLGSEATSAAASPKLQPSDEARDPSLDIEPPHSEDVEHTKKADESSDIAAERQDESETAQEGSTKQQSLTEAPPLPLISGESSSSLPGSNTVIEGSIMDIGPEADTKKEVVAEEIQAEDNNTRDEINGYIERIDALQAKLQYLTKEAADSARQAASTAEAGSSEKRLLEKDEKIALLMDEGQKLSQTEMKHITTIRKMKAQAIAASKEQGETKARVERAQKSISALEERARRAELASKKAEENLAASLNATRDFEAVTKERNALTATLAEMKGQLSRANARADAAETKAQADLVEKERKRNEALQDDLTSAKVDRELSEQKMKREIGDLKASLEREKEHSRVMETEMLGEQAVLESKLETFRARVEEASSNNQGDVQAKLLRQIETLQSQYGAASQNWQGIETTLLSRITNLEKERDDAAAREDEVRKRVRDLTLKTKNSELLAEASSSKALELERQHMEVESELQQALRKLKDLQEALSRAENEVVDTRASMEKETAKRIEEEKTKWMAALPTRTDSPVASIRKGSAFDIGNLMSPVYPPHSRRPSTMHGPGSNTPPRQHSTSVLTSLANGRGTANGTMLETPSIITSTDHEEYFNNIPATPASTRGGSASRGVNDIISTSTVGAGPSVQLVERMSANVRRLESEKAASKDELTRLQTQRDEARSEIVRLMKEVEETRNQGQRLKTLEAEHEKLSKRYDATLEMLGEKSELVEELRADVADVKEMYKELVDTMGKTK